ncbi:MAG: NADH-quinone oxidoreductase subunit NuoE [Chloroflexi bacterium]|nr:NADH-quinone oxidoreductase subunit NuoE [Chloroflexota bacterium]
MVTEETLDLSSLEQVFEEFQAQKGALIPVLQRAQEIYGYLPREVLETISQRTGVPLSQVYGVATFYAQFYLTRRGRHIVRQCDGTACHVRGAAKIITAMEKELGIKAGETTPDYRVTFEVVYCLGSCGLAPVAMVDGEVVGQLVPEKMLEIVRALD